MSSFKRIAAGASALALASGAVLAGAGVAGAQGSSAIAADLELAATALNGPVTVVGNGEDGPTVTYTNETGAAQQCVGFTMPYSTVEASGINPAELDLTDLGAALLLIGGIEAAGGVSVLNADAEGEAVAYASTEANGGVGAAATDLLAGGGVTVPEDEPVVWEAPTPVTPAAAVVLCVPDPDAGLLAVNFGIDPQVVVDQLNGILPGGSIGAGSVSGGSVGMGASLLGSLAADADGGDADNGDSDGSSTASSGVSEAGSGSGDENGELPAATLVN